uniref:ATP synthase complex subunit 8 n=1 Tax=Tyto alba TaxID=56313 RepID=A0A7L8DB64_TYTAL|nr:ATP synthase F0 subunit 8 [Tyto alba]
MPQLNPGPWFPTMLLTWAILSAVIQPKLLFSTPYNPPLNKLTSPIKTTPWDWPWT